MDREVLSVLSNLCTSAAINDNSFILVRYLYCHCYECHSHSVRASIVELLHSLQNIFVMSLLPNMINFSLNLIKNPFCTDKAFVIVASLKGNLKWKGLDIQ